MDTVGLGIPSSVIRFICHIPTGMVGFNGNSLYSHAEGLGDIYDAIPHGRVFLHGLKMVGKGGLATFGWNFPMFVISIICPGPILGFVGLVDWTLASILILGIVQQAKYLPMSHNGCKDIEHWRPGTDGRNFFVEAHKSKRFEGTATTPEGICNAFVQNKDVTIAVIVFYVLCGLINVLCGVFTMMACCGERNNNNYYRPAVRAARPPRVRFWHVPLRDWLGGSGFMGRYVGRPLRPVLLAVDHVVATRRFLWRYVSKYLRYRLRFRGKVAGANTKRASTKSALPFKVVAEIARDLHYADLVSMSRSSPQLRALFLGPDDESVEDRLQALRYDSCEGTKKSHCDICDSQVCADCRYTKAAIADSHAGRHLKNCRPYCTDCYYATFCRCNGRTTRKRGRHGNGCQLSHKEAKTQLQRDIELAGSAVSASSNSYPGPGSTHKQIWTLCRLCAEATPAERVQALEAQDAGEAHRLARLPLTCEGCKLLLPDGGPRWWVCELCGCECPSTLHPSWGATMA